MERLPLHSLVFFGMAIILAVLGMAGFFVHSFAYPLALALAAVFGVAGAATGAASNSTQRGLLFGFVIALALVATYLFVVSGGGGPPSPTSSR